MLTFRQWFELDLGRMGPVQGPNPVQYVPTDNKKQLISKGRGKDSLDNDISSPRTPLKTEKLPPLGNVQVFYKP